MATHSVISVFKNGIRCRAIRIGSPIVDFIAEVAANISAENVPDVGRTHRLHGAISGHAIVKKRFSAAPNAKKSCRIARNSIISHLV